MCTEESARSDNGIGFCRSRRPSNRAVVSAAEYHYTSNICYSPFVTDAGAHGFTTNDEDGDGFLKESGNPRAARICTIIMQRTRRKKREEKKEKKKIRDSTGGKECDFNGFPANLSVTNLTGCTVRPRRIAHNSSGVSKCKVNFTRDLLSLLCTTSTRRRGRCFSPPPPTDPLCPGSRVLYEGLSTVVKPIFRRIGCWWWWWLAHWFRIFRLVFNATPRNEGKKTGAKWLLMDPVVATSAFILGRKIAYTHRHCRINRDKF